MPARPTFLFAPGAGAPSSHPWMQKWRDYLSNIGEVVLFDYIYMKEGRRRPDPLPLLVSAHREALARVQQENAGPVFLAGKSMGGRIGCHVATEDKVDGLICFGYPLCGGGDPTRMRDAVLRRLTTPILFIQGTRDSLCPLALLEGVRSEMKAPNFLHLVNGGDHSLSVTQKRLRAEGITQQEVDHQIAHSVGEFVRKLAVIE